MASFVKHTLFQTSTSVAINHAKIVLELKILIRNKTLENIFQFWRKKIQIKIKVKFGSKLNFWTKIGPKEKVCFCSVDMIGVIPHLKYFLTKFIVFDDDFLAGFLDGLHAFI